MAVAMGTMFVAGTAVPGRAVAIVFVLALLWFCWRTVQGYVWIGPSAIGAPARLVVGSAAMAFVLSGGSGGSARPMAGMSMPVDDPVSALASSSTVSTALILLTTAIAALTVLHPRSVGLERSAPMSSACQLVMNAATVAMLVAM